MGQIRQTSAIVHVIECFDDPNVVHVNGDIDPERDAEIIETELLLSGSRNIEKNLKKLNDKQGVVTKNYYAISK